MNLRGISIAVMIMLGSLMSMGEQWRLHPTYDGNVDRLIDTKDYTYLLGLAQMYWTDVADTKLKYGMLFRYSKDDEELLALNRQNMLSENIVVACEYNSEKGYLAVGYDTGNIDLLFDDGRRVNIPGLKLTGSEYSKGINGFTFNPGENQIWVATDFGYLVLDDEKGEVDYVCNFRHKVESVAKLGNDVFVGTHDSLLRFSEKDSDYSNGVAYPGFFFVHRLIPFGDSLWVWQKYDANAELQAVVRDGDNYITLVVEQGWINSVEPGKEKLVVSGSDEYRVYLPNFSKETIAKFDSEVSAASWNCRDFVLNEGRQGLRMVRLSSEGWTVTADRMFPNASTAFKSTAIVPHSREGILVRNHGINNNFEGFNVPTPDLISAYKGLSWTPLSTSYRLGDDPALEVWNPDGIAIDPMNKNHIYSGSFSHGLLRLDLENPELSMRFGPEGDDNIKSSQFVPVQKEMSFEICPFSAPGFDASGNLWTAWYDYDLDKSKQDALQFWYWTPEDRAATKDAATYRPFKKLNISGVAPGAKPIFLPLTYSTNRNMLFYYNGQYNREFLLLDHKGTPDNQLDDVRMQFQDFSDQYGSPISFNYVNCIYEDLSTGWIWCGMDKGVFYFKPQEMIKDSSTVYRILVARNDGTGFADYLLDGVAVNSIAEDNLGRKWFGTGGGGLVCTSNDGKTVNATYTTDNSEIPDNTVYAVCYNSENNSIMMSTDRGIAELYLSTASGNDAKSSVIAYPNPVRPDYFGYVTITGVEDNALVKIVDSGGNLIKEVGFAAGGEIHWDATNLNSKRVPTGVYYILVSGTSEGSSYSNVGKILVVN